ncbi:phage late control D family protein [Caballeronia sp. AZ7_KS35]|uniref:phage late control D family protein n=1 Tax=Caballeronia sp. AZ7_KS35 TaxID=2921762 RepID=UPI002028A207|nr:phage late control D family protein [Caballeronia sp. AZ7_KS35]
MNAVTKNLTDALRHPSARLTQILNVWIGTLDLDLDVLKFKVKAGLCEDYKVDVTVTSPQLDIDGKTVVGRRAGLQIDERVAVPSVDYVAPVNHEAATFNGVVTRCKRIRTNRDEATYKIRIEPRFAALCKQVQKSDVFRDVTFQELVTQLLIDRTNFDAFDVEFHLEGAQEKMEQIVMYEESVWDMTTRHAKRKGIAWFYKQARGQDGQLDTLVFTDNPRGYVRSIDIPLMPDSRRIKAAFIRPCFRPRKFCSRARMLTSIAYTFPARCMTIRILTWCGARIPCSVTPSGARRCSARKSCSTICKVRKVRASPRCTASRR